MGKTLNNTVPNKILKTANKHMRKYSAILVLGKLKLKPLETTIFSLKWLKIKRLKIARFGKEVEQLQF